MLSPRHHRILVSSLGLLTVAGGVCLLWSEDTLTDRVAVEQTVFDQQPKEFTLIVEGRRLELIRSTAELDDLRTFAQPHGLPVRGPDESGLDYALRAAAWVQKLVPHGRERNKYFRSWGFRRIVDDIAAGERFWCGTYARFLAALALAEGIPARSVWMKGHVTSEIYSAEFGKWVVVDAMYNHTLSDAGRLLSAVEVHALMKSGHAPQVSSISDARGLDEPVKPEFNEAVSGVYGGGIFTVFDGDINFSSDNRHLILPAMSLRTQVVPTGTSLATRLLRLAVPALCLLTLASSVINLMHRRQALGLLHL